MGFGSWVKDSIGTVSDTIFPGASSIYGAVKQDPQQAALAAAMAYAGNPAAAAAMMASSQQPQAQQPQSSSWMDWLGGGGDSSPQAQSSSGFDWTSVIGPLITGTVGGVGNYIQSDLTAQAAKEALDAKKQTDLLNIQLEALKASMEKPMNPTPVWAPGGLGLDDRVNAKQSGANAKSSQLNALISAYQNAMR